MACLSIRLFVTLLCAVSITIAGGVALGVSMSYTLQAAEDYATQYVSAISDMGRRKFVNFLSQSYFKTSSFMYSVEQGMLDIPYNRSLTERMPIIDTWHRIFYTGLDEAQRNLMYFILAFEDQTYIHGNILGGDEFLLRLRDPKNLTSNGTRKTEWNRYYNATTGVLTKTEYLATTYSPLIRPFYTIVNKTYKRIAYSERFLTIYEVPVIAITGSLFAPPPNNNQFVGIISLMFRLDDLSRYLLELPKTANSAVILIDNTDYVIASSLHSTYPAFEWYNRSLVPSSKIHSGCENLTATSLVYCPFPMSAYPHSGFNELKSTRPALVAAGAEEPEKLSLPTAGDVFAAVRRITMQDALYMHWRVVTLIPQADILGTITRGRNYAIIFVAVTIVVCVVLALLGTWLLLRPLSNVATRMYRAANFTGGGGGGGGGSDAMDGEADDGSDNDDDDENDGAVGNTNTSSKKGRGGHRWSALAEIRMIQEAFYTLNDQVGRARQYLPAALLAPPSSDDGDDDDDDEEEMEHHSQSEGTAGNDGDGNNNGNGGRKASRHSGIITRSRRSSAGSAGSHGLGSTVNGGGMDRFTDALSNADRGSTISSSRRRRNPNQAFDSSTIASSRSSASARLLRGGAATGSAAVANAAAAVNTLRSDVGLTRRKASVLYVNLRGFHSQVAKLGGTGDDLLLQYASVVDVLQGLAARHRGILDSFHGDRFVLTFNTARPCGSHATAAVGTALDLFTAASPNPEVVRFTAGITTGFMLVGNMGSRQARRYHTVSESFTRAVLLERFCNGFGLPLLVSDATAADIESGFRTLHVDSLLAYALSCCGAKNGGNNSSSFSHHHNQNNNNNNNVINTNHPTAAGTAGGGGMPRPALRLIAVLGPKASQTISDEWMYELAASEQNHKNNNNNDNKEQQQTQQHQQQGQTAQAPSTAYDLNTPMALHCLNEAVMALTIGDTTAAERLMEQCLPPPPPPPPPAEPSPQQALCVSTNITARLLSYIHNQQKQQQQGKTTSSGSVVLDGESELIRRVADNLRRTIHHLVGGRGIDIVNTQQQQQQQLQPSTLLGLPLAPLVYTFFGGALHPGMLPPPPAPAPATALHGSNHGSGTGGSGGAGASSWIPSSSTATTGGGGGGGLTTTVRKR